MVTFKGVSTGREYETGRVYTTGNGYAYLANRDGSFTNMNTGVVLGGSSGRGNDMGFAGYDERFGGDRGERGGDEPRGADGSGRRVSVGAGADLVSVPGSGVTVGPGAPMVELAFKPGGVPVTRDGEKASVVTTGPGARIAVGGVGSKLTLGDYAPVTPIMIDGVKVIHDKGWSDAGEAEERWGEGEFGSPTWFYSWGVAIKDLEANLPGGSSWTIGGFPTRDSLLNFVPIRGDEYRDEDFLGTGRNPMIPEPELRGAVEW